MDILLGKFEKKGIILHIGIISKDVVENPDNNDENLKEENTIEEDLNEVVQIKEGIQNKEVPMSINFNLMNFPPSSIRIL